MRPLKKAARRAVPVETWSRHGLALGAAGGNLIAQTVGISRDCFASRLCRNYSSKMILFFR